MKKHTRISIFLVSILASLVISPVYGAVGKVIFSHGTVSVERPDPDALTSGMPVEEGDVIVTGANGYVQLLLVDSTKLAIRPSSRFTIVALERPAEGGTPSIGAGLRPRAEFSLDRGGFRTLTGGIASRTPSAYQVSTPNAVIGIRGTNYVARLCSGDCSPGTDDGLFVGVSDGSIFLNNNGGELDLARNQYGYARNFNVAPVRLIAPPASLQDEGLDVLLDEEEEEESDSSEGEETASSGEEGEDSESEGESDAEDAASEFGGDSEVADSEAASTGSSDPVAAVPTAPDQEILANGGDVDLTDPSGADIQSFSFSTSDFALGTVTAGSSLTEDASGNLVAFAARGSNDATESYDIGTAVQSNSGFDPLTGLKWGRWSEGIASVDGNQVDLSNSSLHFVVAPDQPSQVITGSASYVLIGNTDPTDNSGNIGFLGDAQLFADFTNQVVQSEVLLSINNQVWEASGSGAINQALFNGLYETVTINGSATGSGSFGGLFTGFGDATPLGAALNYNLINGSTIVNGAAIFHQAP